MAGAPLEIAGPHKRTEKGNNDHYYGGGDVAWPDMASALAGVPLTIRPGKTIEFGGVAKAVGDTDEGKMKKFTLRINDMQDRIGKLITTFKAGQIEAFEPFLKWVEDLIAIDYAGELHEEQAGVNGLVGAIVSCNDNQEVRNSLVKELQDKYPDFLGNIRAEDVANSLLVERLALVNDKYKERISLAVNQESITEAQEKYTQAVKNSAAARKELASISGKSVAELSGMSINDLITLSNSIVKNTRQAAQDNEEGAFEKYVKAAAIGQLLRSSTLTMRGALKEIGTLQGQNKKIEADYTKEQLANVDKRIAGLNKEIATEKDAAKQKQLSARLTMLEATRREITGETAIAKAPVTGKSQADLDKEAKAAQAKAEKYKNDLTSLRSQYLQISEAAAKGTVDDLDAQLKVIDDKFQGIIEKLKKLLNDPMAKKLGITGELNKDLESIQGKGGLRDQAKDQARADFQKKQRDDEDKANEEQFKTGGERLDNVFNNASTDLGNQEQSELNGLSGDPVMVQQQRLDIQEIYAQKQYELEQAHLQAMIELYTSYGKDTSALEKKTGENSAKENERINAKKLSDNMRYHEAKRKLQDLELDVAAQAGQALQEIVGKNTIAYKAALVVEKAVAAARVVMNTEASIAAFAAANAGIPIVGAALVTAYTIAARISEGLSLAVIAKQTVDGVSNKSAKAAKGGYFEGASHDNGGLDVVDPKTGRVVVNVEGDEPWMVLSKETRRNNSALINQLLFNSMYRNGAAVDTGAIDRGQAYSRFGLGGVVMPAAAAATEAAPEQAPAGMSVEQLATILAPMFAKIDNMADVIDKKQFGLNWQLLQETERKMAQTDYEANA